MQTNINELLGSSALDDEASGADALVPLLAKWAAVARDDVERVAVESTVALVAHFPGVDE